MSVVSASHPALILGLAAIVAALTGLTETTNT